MTMHSHIDRILWTEDQISLRISQIATQIVHDFSAPSPPPIFIGVLTGAFTFLADLVRKINLPVTIDFVSSKSYGSGTVSNCAPTISRDLNVDINGRHVILVLFPL
jgi:hypoxanthine phosphoribosyltransferase